MNQLADTYRLMVENSTDVVFRTDLDGRLDWVSPSVHHLTGWQPEDVIGLLAADLVLPDDQPALDVATVEVLGGGRTMFLGRVRVAAGAERWVSVTAGPIRDARGRVVAGVGTVRDVHDEVLARRALAASEEHYRLLVENTSDVVVKLDPNRTVSWISPNVAAVWGWSSADLVGTVLADLLHPGDLDATRELRDEAYLAAPTGRLLPPLLTRVRMKTGGYRWMKASARAVFSGSGVFVALVVSMHDVDDLVRAREAAEHGEALLRATLDSLFDAHVILDAVRDDDGGIFDLVHVEANDAACRYNQRSREVLIGARLREIAPAAVAEALIEMCSSVIETGVPLVLENYAFPDRAHMMQTRRFDVRAVKVGDGVSHTWRDVTDRFQHDQRMAHLATHDPLTGLANRAALLEEVANSLAAGRTDGSATAILLFDLDRFKEVNDRMGHSVGDELLQAAAQRLVAAVRSCDLVARLGGDEFVVVMRGLDGPSEAHRVGRRLVHRFREPFEIEGHRFVTTASVGVAVSNARTDTDNLFREADIAMYRAKDRGRDRASLFNADLTDADGDHRGTDPTPRTITPR